MILPKGGDPMKDRIKLIRKENKLTQSEMAEKLNVTQSVVAAYENGKREPRNNVIATICEKFDVCEAWLRSGEGPKHPPAPGSRKLPA